MAVTALMSLFMNTEPIALNLIAMSAMPCAQNVIMFSALYEKDSALAAKEVTVSTLVSIVTIPVMLLFVPLV